MRAMAPKGPALQRCCNARGHGPLLQAAPAGKGILPALAGKLCWAPVGGRQIHRGEPEFPSRRMLCMAGERSMKPSQTSHGSSDDKNLSPFVSLRKRDRISYP
jgi:hypothetical protein